MDRITQLTDRIKRVTTADDYLADMSIIQEALKEIARIQNETEEA